MSRSSKFLVLALTATLAISPAALADWSGLGGHEPSTAHDLNDHWMTLTPDRDPSQSVNKVYFNGFLGEALTAANPNVGTTGSAFTASGVNSYWAMLGVWKDCNGDGFVGLGEQGLWEYRSELLAASLNANVCPAATTPLTYCSGPALNWMPSHNDGQWVREFLSISWLTWNQRNTCGGPGDINPYNVNANDTRVWADAGLPEGSTAAGGCAINPQPRGTFHSVGGALYYADCFDGFLVTDTFDSTVAAAGQGGLSFADHPRDQYNSASQANVRNPWGEEQDASYVQAWDCSQPPIISLWNEHTPGVTGVSQPVGFNVTNVSAPSTNPNPNTAGSPSGTANSTANGIDQCNRTHSDGAGGTGAGAAKAPYATESNNANAPLGKTFPTADLSPMETTRPAAPYQAALGKAAPPNLGVQALGQYGNIGTASGSDGLWHNSVNWVAARPTFGHVTYYAYVSSAAVSQYSLTLPNGGATGSYGAERCGSHTTGVWNGWDCDSTHWYRDTNGKDNEPQDGRLGPVVAEACGSTPRAAACVGSRLGSPFDLRDVDCMDQSTSAQRTVGAGPWQVFDTVEPVAHDVLPGAPWEAYVGTSPHVCA